MPTTAHDELYDGRVACTHRSFPAKTFSLDTQFGKGAKTTIQYDEDYALPLQITSTLCYGTYHYSLRVPKLGICDDEPCRDTKRTLILFFSKGTTHGIPRPHVGYRYPNYRTTRKERANAFGVDTFYCTRK